ncbi:uncharacterized protein [Chelonus insularis]|uniref:uncharacterized protein n=1 Tax=Chelonus insularis TaxID=460826 RepID=UPI00158B4279|nr:uncharacterized protein LOC118067622 [Chelonus insularis]
MGKDLNILTSVSKLFTEEVLRNSLVEAYECQDAKVIDWSFEGTSAKGDSYLSTVRKICIKGIIKGNEKDLKIVVKSLPENLGRRKTYRSSDFFYNEIMFYTKIMPLFLEFLTAKNLNHLLYIPKCLGYMLDGENDFIILEDAGVHGFQCPSRQNSLSLDDCKVILKAMAHFHGVSFAYKFQNKEKFDDAAGQLKETYFSEDHWNWYKKFYNLIMIATKDAMAKEYGGTPEEKRFSAISNRDLWERSVKICSRSQTPTSVINQGDAWAPNFLIRTDETTGEKEALLLDFQLARWTGPVTDVSFFIYSCTDRTLRDQSFSYLLNYYHDELSSTISVLGSDPVKIYSLETFMKEVKEEFVHGLNFSFESIIMATLGDDEVYDLDTIKGNDAIDISEAWPVKPLKSQEKRRRLADVIIHAMKCGFL